MTKIIFIRHGQTYSNVNGIISGRINDPKLTEIGKIQAHQAGKTLQEEFTDIDTMIVSGMLRTNQTAEILNQYLNINNIHYDFALQEKNYGNLEGAYSEQYFSFIHSLAKDEPVPGGESATTFKTRVINSFCPYLIQDKESPSIIVSHGHFGRIMMNEFFSEHKHFDNCEYVVIDSEEIPDLAGKCNLEAEL